MVEILGYDRIHTGADVPSSGQLNILLLRGQRENRGMIGRIPVWECGARFGSGTRQG